MELTLMIKNFLAIVSVVVLTACSSSSTPAPDTDTPPAGPGPITPPANPGDGNPPAADTKAGTYIGDFGSGNGVYIISNDNALTGLALATDGSASSVFGDVGSQSTFAGELRGHFHAASVTPDLGIFGAGTAADPALPAFNLNIVNGQSIESLAGPAVNLSFASAGALSPATAATVAGSWSGRHRFCGADIIDCDFLVTEITFNGTDVTGRTFVLKPDGEEVFAIDIAGSITEFGDVSLLSFNWNNNTYNGAVFFVPGSTTELAFVGETLSETDNQTIASLLTR